MRVNFPADRIARRRWHVITNKCFATVLWAVSMLLAIAGKRIIPVNRYLSVPERIRRSTRLDFSSPWLVAVAIHSVRLDLSFVHHARVHCLASELGSVLARDNPRLLTNPFRTVPVGTNGGISLAGCLFSLLGGAIIGISSLVGNMIFCRTDQLTDTSMINLQLFVYCTLFGLLGSLIDSLLGATLQFSGYDPERHMSVQAPGPFIEHISGRNLLSNNQVNLLSSLFTSLIAVFTLPKIIL